MEQFRRPLGVLIAAALVAVVMGLIAHANEDSSAAGVLLMAAAIGVYTAIGAVLVIVWRLVRPARKNRSRDEG